MALLGKKSAVVGLDIGPEKIIAVALEKTAQGLKIANLATIATPKNAIKDGMIVDTKTMAGAIKELFIKGGIKSKDVVVACDGPCVILHLSKLPPMSNKEMKEAIKGELSKFIVFTGFKTISDYYLIEKIDEAGVKKAKVLIVASKKDIADSYVKTIREAELNLSGIGEGTLAVTRALYKNYLKAGAKEAAAVVVVGFDNTVVSVYRGPLLYYTHTIDIGSKDIIAVEDFLSKFISELDSILQFYNSEFADAAGIRKIVFGGNVEKIYRFKNKLEEELGKSGITAEIADPLSGIQYDKNILFKERIEQGFYLSKAIGLAIKGMDIGDFPIEVDLLPLEEIKLNELKKQAIEFLSILGGAVICLVLILVFIRIGITMTKRQIMKIDHQIQNPPPALDRLLEIEYRSKKGLDEMKMQDKLIAETNARSWDEILTEIKTIIPKEVRLTGLNASRKNEVTFAGEASYQEAVFDFERVLKESPYFEDVKLDVVRGKGRQTKLINFVINCELKIEEVKKEKKEEKKK